MEKLQAGITIPNWHQGIWTGTGGSYRHYHVVAVWSDSDFAQDASRKSQSGKWCRSMDHQLCGQVGDRPL